MHKYMPMRRQGSDDGDYDQTDTFSRKRELCIGFFILVSIVYVLARASGQGSDCPEIPVPITASAFKISSTDDISDSSVTVNFNSLNAAPSVTAPLASHATTASTDFSNFDIGAYRAKILSQSTPFIIECAEAEEGGSQEACHLSREKRFAALDQKGVTLWMTGLSGSGKSTIASLLEEQLVTQFGKSVYRLDGDNIRTGLNRDLGFSKADRGESVRRVGELSCLFNDAGTITIVSLVSPYKEDRDSVRKRHEDMGLKFLEVFMDVPLTIVQDRDPKGLYKKVAEGKLKGFTGVDDPYEAPEHAEIVIQNQFMSVQESVDVIMRSLKKNGVLVGGPTLPNGLPYPDGDEIVELIMTPTQATAKRKEADSFPKALLTDIDVNWLQTIAEGWAAPIRGFMREGVLLQTIHFNSVLVDPHNLTGNKGINEMQTDFMGFTKTVAPKRVSMSVPIVLPITDYTRTNIINSGKQTVTLVNKFGKALGILRNPEIYANRKEEIVSRCFGVIDMGHPYIAHIYSGGNWLLGGEIELFERIKYNDGLDKWRLTAKEVMAEFEKKNADAVFAFQTRNPTHAGHAYLMKKSREILLNKGYKNPILWLSPLGGWTKSDDVPLDVRVKQHEAVLNEKMLDPATTVMAIWPAPMIYAGPTEVLFHAKSRRNAGATYFVAGRDPAGMKGSEIAVASPDDDLYDGNHGRYVLFNSPGQYPMDILPFSPVSYDKKDHTMKAKDPKRPNDFIDISGSKMRELAHNGATPCDISHGKEIPSDLIEANCVPPGFMVPTGWAVVCDYYQNVESDAWVPYSIMTDKAPLVAKNAKTTGVYGTKDYKLYLSSGGNKFISPWHDVPLYADESKGLFNMVVEIPMYSTAKMEVSKTEPGNPIMQDEKNNKPRYYSYGVPFFNYGLLPRTWEDKNHVDESTGAVGDADPIDVIELGSGALAMGEVVAVKVIGSLALIDEGETDHKIIAIRQSDIHFSQINSILDLEKYKPDVASRLIDWMKNYKTTDGKGVNTLAQETVTAPADALVIIEQVSGFYQELIAGNSPSSGDYHLPKAK